MSTLLKAQTVASRNRNLSGIFVTDINRIKGAMAMSEVLDQIVETGRRADKAIDRGRPGEIVQIVRTNPKKLIEPVEAMERREKSKAGDAQAMRQSALVDVIRQALPDVRATGVEASLSEVETVLMTRVSDIDSSIAELGSDESVEQAMMSAAAKAGQRAASAWNYVPIVRGFLRRSIRRYAHHATKLQSDSVIRRLRRTVGTLVMNELRSQIDTATEHRSNVRAIKARLTSFASVSIGAADHAPARDTMLPGAEISVLAGMVFDKQVSAFAQQAAAAYPDIDAVSELTGSLSERAADVSGAIPENIEEYLSSGLVRRDQLLAMTDAKARAFAAIDSLVDPWRPRVQFRVVETPGGERSESSQLLLRLNEHGVTTEYGSGYDGELLRVVYAEAMIALPELKAATAAAKFIESQLNADSLASKCTIWPAEVVLAYELDGSKDEQDDHRLLARLIALKVLERNGDCWYVAPPELRGLFKRLGPGGLIARGLDTLLAEIRTDKESRQTLEEIGAEMQQAKGIVELRRIYRDTMRRTGLVPEFFEPQFLQALHDALRSLPAVDDGYEAKKRDEGNAPGDAAGTSKDADRKSRDTHDSQSGNGSGHHIQGAATLERK